MSYLESGNKVSSLFLLCMMSIFLIMGCSAPHDTDLYDKDSVYMLEYVPHKIFITRINIKNGNKYSVLLKGKDYNNLSIIDGKAFVSVYREEGPLGLEAASKVDIYSLNGKKKRTIKLLGSEPTYIYATSANILVDVRTLDQTRTSGFLVYSRDTLKFQKAINLGRDFIDLSVCSLKNKNGFYVIGNALVNTGKSLRDIPTFFELDVRTLEIKQIRHFDDSVEGVINIQPLKNGLIASLYTKKGSRSIDLIMAQTLKPISQTFLPFKPYLIRVNQDQTFLALSSNLELAIFDLKANKIIAKRSFSGIRDMQFLGDSLAINQNPVLGNGYEGGPQIQILDAHTLTEQHIVQGNFGHFALMFNH